MKKHDDDIRDDNLMKIKWKNENPNDDEMKK